MPKSYLNPILPGRPGERQKKSWSTVKGADDPISFDSIIKEFEQISGIPYADGKQIMNMYYRQVKKVLLAFEHPRIVIRGIGTLHFRHMRLLPIYRMGGSMDYVTPFQKIYKQYRKDQDLIKEAIARKREGRVHPTTERLRKAGDNNRKR